MSYLRLVYKNLFRNTRRTVLTLLGVVISFLLFVSIFTLLESFDRFLKSEDAQVNLFFRPTYMSNFIDGQLPEAYLHQLEKIPLIKYLTPYKVYLGTGRSEQNNIFALGVFPDQISHMRNMAGLGPAELAEFNAEKKAAVVGVNVMKDNQWKLGQEVILKPMRGLHTLPLHIVGVTNAKSDFPDIVVVRYDYLKDILDDAGIFSIALLRVESPHQVPWISQVIRERFENSEVPVETISEKGFVETILSEFSAIAKSIKVIAWITLLATLFVVGNTMAMSIRERSVDQGVLRTLGFSKLRVFSLYMSEAVLIAVFGGLLGGVIGCGIFQHWEIILHGGGGGGGTDEGLLIVPYWALMGQVFYLSLAMGLLSGFPPAYFAMKKKITDTLRFVA